MDVLFEETQRPDYRDRSGRILAAVSFFVLTLLARDYIWTVVFLWAVAAHQST